MDNLTKLNITQLEKIMRVAMIIGILFVIAGVGLAMFTDLTYSMGSNGVLMIALIIGFGLVLLIPSKVYLTFVFF